MPIENEVAFANEETFQNMLLFQKERPTAPQNRRWLPVNVISMRQNPQVSREVFIAGGLCLLPL